MIRTIISLGCLAYASLYWIDSVEEFIIPYVFHMAWCFIRESINRRSLNKRIEQLLEKDSLSTSELSELVEILKFLTSTNLYPATIPRVSQQIREADHIL